MLDFYAYIKRLFVMEKLLCNEIRILFKLQHYVASQM